MTATNHALSGALIASVLPLPVAIPLAFASHFVLDAIPHFSVEGTQRDRSRLFKTVVSTDTVLALSLAILAAHYKKWSMLICGVVAFSPDIIWLAIAHSRKSLNTESQHRFNRFHSRIQRWESVIGLVPEIIVFLIMAPFFFVQVLK